MYYREEIINGVLCCKYTPDGAWNPLSKEELTKRIEILQKKLDLIQSNK